MAEIHDSENTPVDTPVQRKPSQSWVGWLVAALFVVGAIWWMVEAREGNTEIAANTVNATAPGTMESAPRTEDASAENAALAPEQAVAKMPLAAIAANPDAHFGEAISGLATISETISNRAFWIEQDGNRMLVVTGQPSAGAGTITTGQQVSLTGTVINPDKMQEQAPGVLELDESTRKMLQEQPAFLQATNVEIQNP